ncbi:hypothetical protein GGP41_002888 [Bipolaris sorokiniana]|uniref:Cytochrome P450 n=1 Tax=Cochliobolus sativus TaxID=45130 RepID=A0A8H5Z9K9_COCSA|nr:hypothetical protein GGP41_002888 [Bipolaris sorokiniana]
MALQDLIFDVIGAHVALTVTLAPLLILFIRSIYRIYFHPLAHIPGPILSKLTSLWLHYHAYTGDEASVIHKLHQQYGPYVRVSPNEVDLSDADGIPAIYVSKGGFPKAKCYANFDIDGHKTIFSTTNQEYRASRAKAVLPLFSTKSLRENEMAIWGCVDCVMDRLKEEAKTKRPVNVLNLARSLAVDVVSTHLFRENYDGVNEKGPVLSVSAFVDAFVAVGRFFYLPNIAFVWLEWAVEKWAPDRETDDSMSLVDKFVATLVGNTTSKSTTYPGPGGWTFKGTYFPAGSLIGCSAYELHFNPIVFTQPQEFIPERWLDTTEDMSKYWFAFGAGSRACIARNLATMELQFATERLAKTGVLDGARAVQKEVEIYEWFNSKVKGGKIELVWE